MAIFLPPVSRDVLFLQNIFSLLFHLAYALLERSEEFEKPEGIRVKYPIESNYQGNGVPLSRTPHIRLIGIFSLLRFHVPAGGSRCRISSRTSDRVAR